MSISLFNLGLSFAAALALHEAGHFLAARVCRVPVSGAGFGWGPKVFSFRSKEVDYQFRALPIGAFIKMDMSALQQRPLLQQLFVLLAGVVVNFALSAMAWGTFFGTLNLILAVVNLFPLYQQDGWKTLMVISRRVFQRPSPIVEWTFTISAVVIGLILVSRALFLST